jgi:hypothetical protein
MTQSYTKSSPPNIPEPESNVLKDARADARWCSTDAVMASRDVFLDNASDLDLDETARYMAAERFRAFDDELNRRIRIVQLDPKTAARRTRECADWKSLADDVKQRVSVRDVLELAGFHIIEDGSGEAHSSCPVCGGHDRLVIWPKKSWCRQCRWSVDAIAAAQSFLPGATHFRDAVRLLDDLASVKGGAR